MSVLIKEIDSPEQYKSPTKSVSSMGRKHPRSREALHYFEEQQERQKQRLEQQEYYE